MYALQQLEDHLKEGACALDVGSGSGYLTAAMAYMVILSHLKTVGLCCTFSQTFYISHKGHSLSGKTSRNLSAPNSFCFTSIATFGNLL